jgi:hypothetical protein
MTAKPSAKQSSHTPNKPRVSSQEWEARIFDLVERDPKMRFGQMVEVLQADVPTASPLTIGERISRTTIREKGKDGKWVRFMRSTPRPKAN